MNEPRLQDIEDYDTLKGSKKRVVWGIVIAGIVIAMLYGFVSTYFDGADEAIEIKESIKTIPLK